MDRSEVLVARVLANTTFAKVSVELTIMHETKLLKSTVLRTNCPVKEAEPAKVAVVHSLQRKVDGIPPKHILSQFDFKQSVFID